MLDIDDVHGAVQAVADAARAGPHTVEIATVYPFKRTVEAAVFYATAKPSGENRGAILTINAAVSR